MVTSGFGNFAAQFTPTTVASFRTWRGLRAKLARGPKPDKPNSSTKSPDLAGVRAAAAQREPFCIAALFPQFPGTVQSTFPVFVSETRLNVPYRAKITAIGTYVPPRVLTNADLEKMVETSNEWILTRTGISERHIVEPGMATSDMAVEAARNCLEERGIFTVHDLLQCTRDDLLSISNFGEKTLDEVYKALEGIGFYRQSGRRAAVA